ncbi:hypothetical protein SB816_10870 [Achromobacter sp. SIMBA_011]|uniref:hypothetical protein n=1 Tax=Achromobacter TaxID=222 RepID=UPI0012E31BD5|nr:MULTISPECIES: hypothetical protein [Achromobacter]MCZ8384159.1 hypothetical protein [Achromobacter xylosoxidans]
MEDIKTALNRYLNDNYSDGDIVEVKKVRDDLAPDFLYAGNPLSKILSEISSGFRALVRARMLERVRPGVYYYRPNKYSDSIENLPVEYSGRSAVSIVEPQNLIDIMKQFEDVKSLARSSVFLIQRDLATADVGLLQEVSF